MQGAGSIHREKIARMSTGRQLTVGPLIKPKLPARLLPVAVKPSELQEKRDISHRSPMMASLWLVQEQFSERNHQ
jgi:hypothetical protein